MQVDILVGGIVGRRCSAKRPVRRGYTSRMLNSSRASGITGFGAALNGARRRSASRALLAVLPREPRGDIHWMDNMCAGFLRGQYRAVEPARQQYE